MRRESYTVLDPLRDLRHRSARSAPDVAAWLAWLELGGKTDGTLEQYEWTLAALLRAYPHTAVNEFTDGQLGVFLLEFPPGSRLPRRSHLSSFFKWARLTRRIEANPMDLLPTMKKPHQPVIDVFTVTERAALCSLPLPDGPLMRVLLEAGLRRSEAINLTGKRIDFERGDIIVKEGAKGSRDRKVPMTDTLAGALDTLLTLEGIGRDDFLWYDKPGGGFAKRVRRSQPINFVSFSRWWKRCLDEAGVAYRKPHTARHTYATWLKDIGMSIEDIQQNLGHASINTTVSTYVHFRSGEIGERMRERIRAQAI